LNVTPKRPAIVVIHLLLAENCSAPIAGAKTALLELALFASQSKSASIPTTAQLN